MIQFESLLKTTKAYQTVMNDKKNGNLNHCIMLLSEDEVACNNLALLLARDIMCKNDGCATCYDCKSVEKLANSNLIVLYETKAAGIKDFVAQCAYSIVGEVKVALIQNFQEIEQREQNRLLKLLEEPQENLVFVCAATRSSLVLDTIKSRALKFSIESFSEESLINELNKYYDEVEVQSAVEFAEGSITNAKNFLDNKDFIESYSTIIEIMDNLKKSAYIMSAIAAIKLNNIDYNARIKSALVYLDAFELVLKQLLEINTNLTTSSNEVLNRIAKEYNVAAIVNIEELVIDAKIKVDNRCEIDEVFYNLFFKMLEVKYKCQ